MDTLRYKILAIFVSVVFVAMGFVNNVFASGTFKYFTGTKDQNIDYCISNTMNIQPETYQYFYYLRDGVNPNLCSCAMGWNPIPSQFYFYAIDVAEGKGYFHIYVYNGSVATKVDVPCPAEQVYYQCSGTQYSGLVDMSQSFHISSMPRDMFIKNTLKSNVPCYSSVELGIADITNDGIQNSGEPYEGYSSGIQYDSSVECPQNVYLDYNNFARDVGAYKFNIYWKQSQDFDYKTEVCVGYIGQFSRQSVFGNDNYTDFSTNSIPYKKVDCSSDNNLEIIENFNDIFTNAGYMKDSFTPYKIVNDKCTLIHKVAVKFTHIYFLIRNLSGNKSSDWVRLDYDVSSKHTTTSIGGIVTGSKSETDTNNTTVIDGNTSADNIVTGGGTTKDSYKPDTGADDVSSGNIIDNLKSCFGLLGDNGIIQFFKGVFSFIPEEFFGLLYTFVGTCSVIAVFKFIRG